MRFGDYDPGPTAPPVTAQPLPQRHPDVVQRFAPLVQLAPDATVVADSDGRIRLVNRLAEELFGYSADELPGQPVELLLPEGLRTVHEQHRVDYAAAPFVRPMGAGLPLSGRRRDGSVFPLEASLGPLDVEGESLVIVSIRDITEREQLYAARAASETANQDLRALQALTDTALSHLSLDDLVPALLERIADVLGVDNAAVFLLDPTGKVLTVQAARQRVEPMVTEVRVPVGQGFVGRITATREPLVEDDIATFPIAIPLFREQFRSVAGVPLEVGDQLLGVVLVATAVPRHFTTRDVQLLQQVADRMALAIDRARLYTAEQQARQALAERVAQLEAVMEAVPYALAVHDTTGQVILANAVYQANVPPGKTLAERIRQVGGVFDEQGVLLDEARWPQTRALQGEVLAGTRAIELTLHSPDGEPVYSRVTAAPLRDQAGSIIGVVTLNQNITEQKRLEYEREAAHASELAAQDVARQLDAFLATAAHDIRSPVTVISGQVQVALRRAERLAEALYATAPTASKSNPALGPAAEGVVDSLRSAQSGVGRLRRLVDHLFDVAQAQTGRLALELAPCDLAALVRRNVALQQAAAPERRVDLEAPPGEVSVLADADRLDQVLSNYLTNALKYSAHDRPVAVRLVVVKNLAEVSVEDHGPGLPPEEQIRVWEAFHRAPGVEIQPGNSQVGGSLGLGLHICKQLIELHPGGTVGVESVVGQGSTFWFRLPLARTAPSKRR